jgi:hypothetical protein
VPDTSVFIIIIIYSKENDDTVLTNLWSATTDHSILNSARAVRHMRLQEIICFVMRNP